MPGLTVAEKTHWKDRIAARIDRAVERVRARNPALFARSAARPTPRPSARRAWPVPTPSRRRSPPRRRPWPAASGSRNARMLARSRRPIEEVSDSFSVRHGLELPLPLEASEAIARRQAAHQEEMLADDPVGREVARLGAEKESLLDTVWLAASPAQIKQLWSRVAELLGDEPTALEARGPGHRADQGGLMGRASVNRGRGLAPRARGPPRRRRRRRHPFEAGASRPCPNQKGGGPVGARDKLNAVVVCGCLSPR